MFQKNILMKKIKLILILYLLPILAFPQYTDQSNWQNIGPFNQIGSKYECGRLDAIALHPKYGVSGDPSSQTIYAGGNNGGLWVTIDDGENWTNISTNKMMFSGVADIAITSDGSYLYVSDIITPWSWIQRGSGVYKYDISTKQWSTVAYVYPSLPNPMPGFGGTVPLNYEVRKNRHLKIHPTDDLTVFACTNYGIARTTDGTNWATVTTSAPTAEIENIAFVPNSNSIGGYDIYASGNNKFMISTDKGASFNDVGGLSPNNPFTNYTTPKLDIAYGGLDVDGTSNIIYLYGYDADGLMIFYKYKIPSTGSPIMTFIGSKSGMNVGEHLCIYGDKNVVYMGGDRMIKYNFSSNSWLSPVPSRNALNDVTLTSTNTPDYYYPGTNSYNTMVHPDLHDIKVFDNGTIRKIFVATDGGLNVNNYIPTTTVGVYTNYWSYKVNGLHIAQINGMSGSELDPDYYATGEQDTKGFMFNSTDMTKCFPFGVEPAMVLIDKEKKDRLFHNNYSATNDLNVRNLNFESAPGSTVSATNTDLYDPIPNVNYFKPDLNAPSSANGLPKYRMFYQDPVRPERIYAFGRGLWQFDEATQVFGLKYRTGKFFNDANILHKDESYFSTINSMTVSRTNKNKIFMVSDNYISPNTKYASQVYRYTGSNIDDSWGGVFDAAGHNDTNWDLITPNLNAPPFNLSLSDDEIIAMQYTSIVMSDWDENKLWVLSTKIFPEDATQLSLKVLKYDNGSWSNYSQNIPAEETPLTMVYERGSNDGIYLTTERSMYYRNASMSRWEKYDDKIPHLFTFNMEINYKENTLRAGTYGRGIWKTNLVCPTAPLAINSCSNCNTATNYFWEGTNVTIKNTLLNTRKQIVRAVDFIEITPATLTTSVEFNPAGNSNVYFELFIHGCGPTTGNSFKSYSMVDSDLDILPEVNKITNIGIYPNPNNGTFVLNVESENIKNIYVYDLLGKVVYQVNNSNAERFDIDITDQTKGIYVVKVVDGDKVEVFKVLNQ